MDNGIFTTGDIALAVYLKIKGLKVTGNSGSIKDGSARIMFADPEHKVKELKIKFVNSESQLFDSGMRSIKKLFYG